VSAVELATSCRSAPLVVDGFCADLCRTLAELVLARAQRDRRSAPTLNVGGWKSAEDFFAWPDACVQELRRRVVDQVRSPRLVAWAIVNRAGSWHPRHQHRAAALAGVCYVAAGEGAAPTLFEFEGLGEVVVEPVPGRLVVVRGETWHRVPASDGAEPRVTVAFDVRR